MKLEIEPFKEETDDDDQSASEVSANNDDQPVQSPAKDDEQSTTEDEAKGNKAEQQSAPKDEAEGNKNEQQSVPKDEAEESKDEVAKENKDETVKESKKEPAMKCEVQEREARYNLKGVRTMKVVERKEEPASAESNESVHAIVSYKWYDRGGETEVSYLEIYSQYILEALRTVIESYPGNNFDACPVYLYAPYRPLFHYRKELKEYVEAHENQEAKLHLLLLLQYFNKELEQSIKTHTAQVESTPAEPSLPYRELWMIFPVGVLIVSGAGDDMQVSECTDLEYVEGGLFGGPPQLKVWGKALTHDGTSSGYIQYCYKQSQYEGLKEIKKLSVLPLKFHPRKDQIREKLIARGKKFWSLTGMHYRYYKGLTTALGHEIDRREDDYPTEDMMIDSRIIVDAKMFGVVKAPNRIRIFEKHKSPSSFGDEKADLTDDDYLVCDRRVPGFSLFDKRWCWFYVDLIDEIKFDADAFDSLHIPPDRKHLVRALVQDYVSSDDDFDDLIQGKGKGLVFVLHGVPGVGKTYTAEAVADDIQRPLYILNSGELGDTPQTVETNLVAALKLSTAWKAIVLIDEADVFLEQRTSQDLTRNCLVSLFLRHLEYYKGVMFLTTNRISSFDLAFKSRIHLALKYQDLDQSQKESLWDQFLKRTKNIDETYWTEELIKEVSTARLNGRQIKNAVRTSNTLARSKATKLTMEHVGVVLNAMNEFEDDLNDETQDPFLGTSPTALRRLSMLGRAYSFPEKE